MEQKVYATPNISTPNLPIIIDPDKCTGCNKCVDVCPSDIFMPNPKKGKPPIILFPDECWYDGSCVMACPHKGAIELRHPLMQRVRWKRKESGEHFRV